MASQTIPDRNRCAAIFWACGGHATVLGSVQVHGSLKFPPEKGGVPEIPRMVQREGGPQTCRRGTLCRALQPQSQTSHGVRAEDRLRDE